MASILPFNEVFKKKIFRIPDYQRGYSWEQTQLEDLWADLSNIHLQNNVNGKIYLGAFFQDKLVAAMSFGELRVSLGSKKEENTFEMLRYACSGNIPGIGSKLLTYFIRT